MYFTIHLCILLLFAGCHRHDHAHNHDHDHDHSHDGHEHVLDHDHDTESVATENPNAISFSKDMQAKIDFETTLPVMEKFGQLIKTTARIQSSSADEMNITAKTSGIVVFSKNDITEGLAVSAGESLFVISDAGLAENNIGVRFSEAAANFRKAEAEYNRSKLLIEDGIISQKDYQNAQTEYETAKAVSENLSKNFDRNGQKVSSSMSGYIKQVFVENGQYVEEGQNLFIISKNENLLLKAEVQAKYAALLPFVSSATIRSMDKSRFYSLEELNGKLLSYGKSISEDNYLIPLIFRVNNKSGFIPGGLVEMYIRTESDREVMTIPVSAITEEQGLFFVYIQLAPELFEKRNVQTGTTDGIRTEIRSGINKEERIVSKGAISVKLAQSAGILDPHAGHVH
jgi:RND family efflux transporter, MFP subunit